MDALKKENYIKMHLTRFLSFGQVKQFKVEHRVQWFIATLNNLVSIIILLW